MSDVRDGGPAFPGPAPDMELRKVLLDRRRLNIPDGLDMHAIGKLTAFSGGMTLRDYFAGQALTGILAGDMHIPGTADPNPFVAGVAYDVADAMLAERANGEKP